MYSSLIRPSMTYTNWDANKIQGCLCDIGYEGFDCSRRACPKGRDPMQAQYDTNEVWHICMYACVYEFMSCMICMSVMYVCNVFNIVPITHICISFSFTYIYIGIGS